MAFKYTWCIHNAFISSFYAQRSHKEQKILMRRVCIECERARLNFRLRLFWRAAHKDLAATVICNTRRKCKFALAVRAKCLILMCFALRAKVVRIIHNTADRDWTLSSVPIKGDLVRLCRAHLAASLAMLFTSRQAGLWCNQHSRHHFSRASDRARILTRPSDTFCNYPLCCRLQRESINITFSSSRRQAHMCSTRLWHQSTLINET